MLSNWRSCFNAINLPHFDDVWCVFSKSNESVQRMTYTNFPISCQQTTKTTWKCNTDSFGPVFRLWFATLKCMCDSKPQRYVQQHKSLKGTRNAINRDKHINEASKQIFANNLCKISCKYTQDMLSNWKISFNVFNARKHHEILCVMSKTRQTL